MHAPASRPDPVLVVHETHTVAGVEEEAFEAAWRDGFLPALGVDDSARLLHFLHQAHGSGPAYTVVTLTAVRDAAAWEALAGRLRDGDLAAWVADVDGLRHDHQAKVLAPLPFSPLQDLDLASIPAEPQDHAQVLFMEDTAWPYRGKYEAYLEKAGTLYLETLAANAGRSLLGLEAAFSPVWGTDRRREIVLWQRVVKPEALPGLFSHDVPAEYRGPGTWMHDALEVRDRWESRLLRSAPWSPVA